MDEQCGQITFDYLRTETGEIVRGRIAPADRPHLAGWLSRLGDEPESFALEPLKAESVGRPGVPALASRWL